MIVYHTSKICINRSHSLFSWCETITSCATNLSNACRFRQRQILTAKNKNINELTDNEKKIVNEFLQIEEYHSIKDIPNISYKSMEKVMRINNNPDFFAKGLPRQSAQHVLQNAISDMKNYYASLKEWYKHPKKYKSKPNLPGYKKKGSHSTVYISNQDCTFETKDGKNYAKLPLIKKIPVQIGEIDGIFKYAQVCPNNGEYEIHFTFEIEKPDKTISDCPSRIIGIDLGVNNLMAVTNNCGLPCFLFKGGIIKSVNQLYNKKLSKIMSDEMASPNCPKNKNGKPKFIPTLESQSITRKRVHSLQDFMHKSARYLIRWCVENRIDTIVMGLNSDWKQKSNMSRTSNQNFIQVPFAYLRYCIEYLAQEHGILYITQEESYTSKASFLDNDPIPIYGNNDDIAVFSGQRAPIKYKGMYKKTGFRGLYQANNGTIINSDLNGSANILRKAFPKAFSEGQVPDFFNVIIIRNPDEQFILANRKKQLEKKEMSKSFSKSKYRRLKKKLKSLQSKTDISPNVIPLG
jgi:putative transposase